MTTHPEFSYIAQHVQFHVLICYEPHSRYCEISQPVFIDLASSHYPKSQMIFVTFVTRRPVGIMLFGKTEYIFKACSTFTRLRPEHVPQSQKESSRE